MTRDDAQFMMPMRVSMSGRIIVHLDHIGRMHATVRRMLMPMQRVAIIVITRPIRFDRKSINGDRSATAMYCMPSIASAIDGDRSTWEMKRRALRRACMRVDG